MIIAEGGRGFQGDSSQRVEVVLAEFSGFLLCCIRWWCLISYKYERNINVWPSGTMGTSTIASAPAGSALASAKARSAHATATMGADAATKYSWVISDGYSSYPSSTEDSPLVVARPRLKRRGMRTMTVWDERRLAKSLRIAAKELRLFQEDAQRFSEKLSAVEGDGERADALAERADAWSELADSIDAAIDEFEGALEAVESLL